MNIILSMSRASPEMKQLAAKLVECEVKATGRNSLSSPLLVRVSETLRPTLSTLMGKMGYSALLGRAVGLARADFLGLGVISVSAEGKLVGWADFAETADKDDIAAANIVVIAQLLGLMTAFIGDDLTLRIIRQLWPKFSPTPPNLKK